MRTHGTLVKWNDDRGFGFIEPASGSEEIFVHVSAFPRDGIRPHIGELVSFDIDAGGDDRKRAMRVMRPGGNTTPWRATRRACDKTAESACGHPELADHRRHRLVRLFILRVETCRAGGPPGPMARRVITAIPVSVACDGRTRCPQMTSCAEATYFLKQCPGTRMDGDGDGIPCESQWCTADWED